MALIDDDPGRFKSGGYFQMHTAEYTMALALKTAAEEIQHCLYYERAGYDLLEDDHETKALLDAAYLAIRPVLLRYFGEDELGLFYEPAAKPEPVAEAEAPKPEVKKRVVGLPFRRKG